MATYLPPSMLSPHFSLHELLASQTATRKNITEQFEPPKGIIDNLKFICESLLEKLRELNGGYPLIINSGYRCTRLNKAVGGVSDSQHLQGQAADIDFGSITANKQFFDKVKKSTIKFDQLLNEYNYSWVHVSMKKEGNRREVLDIT
ncbi:MAG: D-Ala-D-Ala carboxypeptidase family metallohydrolase [Chitinophagaceae bacterium]